jgi:hypothetical protein
VWLTAQILLKFKYRTVTKNCLSSQLYDVHILHVEPALQHSSYYNVQRIAAPCLLYVKEKFHVQIGYITMALEANEILRSDEECHIPQCVVYDNIYRYYGI